MPSKKQGGPARASVKDALANWSACNEYLRDCSEQEAQKLLAAERSGKGRVQYLLRAHARMNRLRAQRERAELLQESGGG